MMKGLRELVAAMPSATSVDEAGTMLATGFHLGIYHSLQSQIIIENLTHWRSRPEIHEQELVACAIGSSQPGDDPFGLLPQPRGQRRVVGDRFGLGALAMREVLPGDARDRRVRGQEDLRRRAL